MKIRKFNESFDTDIKLVNESEFMDSIKKSKPNNTLVDKINISQFKNIHELSTFEGGSVNLTEHPCRTYNSETFYGFTIDSISFSIIITELKDDFVGYVIRLGGRYTSWHDYKEYFYKVDNFKDIIDEFNEKLINYISDFIPMYADFLNKIVKLKNKLSDQKLDKEISKNWNILIKNLGVVK